MALTRFKQLNLMDDTALYIQLKGRGWVVWHNEHDELIGVPEDEEPYSQDDLLALEQYLYAEGFFADHYARRLAKLDQLD
jgi:hypothetical protein